MIFICFISFSSVPILPPRHDVRLIILPLSPLPLVIVVVILARTFYRRILPAVLLRGAVHGLVRRPLRSIAAAADQQCNQRKKSGTRERFHSRFIFALFPPLFRQYDVMRYAVAAGNAPALPRKNLTPMGKCFGRRDFQAGPKEWRRRDALQRTRRAPFSTQRVREALSAVRSATESGSAPASVPCRALAGAQ